MKKEDKKQPAKTKRGNTPLVVQQFVNVAPDRNRKDVGTLKESILRAESVNLPNRARLYDLYHDVVTLDGHLSGLLEKRTKSVTNKSLYFADSAGRKIDALDTLIESTPFGRLMEIMMESIYWGTAGVEFIVGREFSFEEIDKRHIRPESRQIAKSQWDVRGIDIDTLPYCWMIGRKHDLGRLLQCSMYALYKRSGIGDFAQYVEIFGQPVRIIKYDAYDKKTQEELRRAMDESGSSLVMILPKQADFEMLDGKNQNGTGELQERLIKVCNQEMSIAILGNSETTASSRSSGYAQALVHAGQQLEITKSDMRYVQNLLNSPYFLNILAGYGYPVQGGRFLFEEERDIEFLKQRIDIDLKVATRVPVGDDYWYDTYGIPKPDNYDELKQKQEEQRRALLEAARDRDTSDDDAKNDTKKKRLADFFGLPPR